jgi:thiol-disulfide isomerase/thioredoxin
VKTCLLFLSLLANATAFAQILSSAEMDTLLPPMGAMRKAAIGKPFGDFVAAADSRLTPESFQGKTVFVNFWFESCKPCVTELDGLNALYKQTKDKANFLFVSFTFEPLEKLNSLREKYGLQYPVYHVEANDCQRLNRGLGFPTNVLIDSSGKINHITFSGAADKKSAEAFLHNEFFERIVALSQNQ